MTRRVTQAEFARLCGVNRSTVHRWIQNQRIQADAHGLIDPDAAQQMRTATESPLPHHQARKAQFDEAREAASTTPQEKTAPAPPDDDESGVFAGHRKPADIYMARKAEKLALEIDKMAGVLVDRAEVDYVLADFGNTVRGLLEGMADRLAPTVAAHRGDVSAVHRELEDTAAAMLSEIADHIQRKANGLGQ